MGQRWRSKVPEIILNLSLFVIQSDFAMQLLSRLTEHILKRRAQRVTIIGATSGDTGGAAVHAFSRVSNVDTFVLFPQGRISEVQRRQMTTAKDGKYV